MEPALAIIAATGLVLAFIYLLITQRKEKPPRERPPMKKQSEFYSNCPLCRTPLQRGERVHMVVYPGKPDQIVHITGCPYCTGKKDLRRKTCPVCKKSIAARDHIIARMFQKPSKTHIHVLGCPKCREPRPR